MISLSQPIPNAGRKLPANLVRSSKWSGHSPFKAVMRGSSPARITIWCLRLMDSTPASQAGNTGSTPVGITKVLGHSQRANPYIHAKRNCSSWTGLSTPSAPSAETMSGMDLCTACNWGRNWHRKYRVVNNPFIRCPGSKAGAFLIS